MITLSHSNHLSMQTAWPLDHLSMQLRPVVIAQLVVQRHLAVGMYKPDAAAFSNRLCIQANL